MRVPGAQTAGAWLGLRAASGSAGHPCACQCPWVQHAGEVRVGAVQTACGGAGGQPLRVMRIVTRRSTHDCSQAITQRA